MSNKEEVKNEVLKWTICLECNGSSLKRRKLRKKVRLQYQKALDEFEKTEQKEDAPIRPKGALEPCPHCNATGLIPSDNYPESDNQTYPHIAIIGGGIGGVALAVACLHRSIPFTLYERDNSFDERHQGYGLTLQQASKAIQGLGILSLAEGLISTRHVVHATDGGIIVEWGARKWLQTEVIKTNKRTNVHIPRQSLRLELLKQLGDNMVQWGHQLIDFKDGENGGIELNFNINGKTKQAKADLIVGADGIRSTVRRLQIGEENTPLQYLGCIVILGICPLGALENINSDLLDSKTVFQTVNGTERLYVMPYDSDTVMWQFSYPITEKESKVLSALGTKALKEDALKRMKQWHNPVPQIINATPKKLISGYPVYDRALLQLEMLTNAKQVTLIGDAAHPMSAFKGQGANQALLDALVLARGVVSGCNSYSQWRANGIRASVLKTFEAEMIARTAAKVKGSAEAAKLLHTEIVLRKGPNAPTGRSLK